MDTLIFHVAVQADSGADHDELAKAIQDDLVDTHEMIEAATVSFQERRPDPEG